jgi:hypothetical protein
LFPGGKRRKHLDAGCVGDRGVVAHPEVLLGNSASLARSSLKNEESVVVRMTAPRSRPPAASPGTFSAPNVSPIERAGQIRRIGGSRRGAELAWLKLRTPPDVETVRAPVRASMRLKRATPQSPSVRMAYRSSSDRLLPLALHAGTGLPSTCRSRSLPSRLPLGAASRSQKPLSGGS